MKFMTRCDCTGLGETELCAHLPEQLIGWPPRLLLSPPGYKRISHL